MQVLLDTCAFLWLIGDANYLSSAARQVVAQSGNQIFLSSISAWEMAVKHAAGKLELADSVEVAVSRGRDEHDVQALAFEEQCTFHLPRLPPIHRDPFDWMLICQAIEHDLIILTPDPMIRKYPIKTLW